MDQYKPTEGDRKIHEQLVNSAWCGLLSALTVLLEACTDEAATENILKAMQVCLIVWSDRKGKRRGEGGREVYVL